MHDRINEYLRQPVDEPSTFDQSRSRLVELHEEAVRRLAAFDSSEAPADSTTEDP